MTDVDDLLTELRTELAAVAERLVEVEGRARAAADARPGGLGWPELMDVDHRCHRALKALRGGGESAEPTMDDLRRAVEGRWYGPPVKCEPTELGPFIPSDNIARGR